MAIDRTFYNALVDDDGSGLVGSVWDKADIANLLDAVDGIGTWQNYTPTWTGSVSNPSLGNGTLVGRYAVIGKTVHFTITLTIGSTTTTGSGIWFFTLPLTAVDSQRRGIGIGWAGDVGVADYPFTVLKNFDNAHCMGMTGANTFLSGTSPFTFGNTDQISLTGTYEIA